MMVVTDEVEADMTTFRSATWSENYNPVATQCMLNPGYGEEVATTPSMHSCIVVEIKLSEFCIREDEEV